MIFLYFLHVVYFCMLLIDCIGAAISGYIWGVLRSVCYVKGRALEVC